MSLRQKVDSFRGDCFVITNDGEKIPLRVESIDFDPHNVGPEIHGYLLEHIRVKENDSPIKKVIFNNPATVVIWEDGTKTVVKCQKGDTYSEELGLAMCIAKKFFGNKGNFNEVFKKWLPKGPELSLEDMREAISKYCHSRSCSNCVINSLPGHVDGRCYMLASDKEVVKHYRAITESNPFENGIPKVGTKIKIIDAKWGAIGANGLCGVVTNRRSDGGRCKDEPGYNVDTGKFIWRINLDAEIEILN